MRQLIILIFSSVLLNVPAQEISSPEVTVYKIQSKVFGDERQITVHIPPARESKEANPGLVTAYLFDGQFTPYFTMVNGMVDYYTQTNNGLPMIIVSIQTKDRWSEFIPSSPDRNTSTYQSDLSNYLREEVFPFIDSVYKTQPFRVGIGHSLGGTFLLFDAFSKKPLFDAVIAASPNTINNNNELIGFGAGYLEKNPSAESFVYVTAGTTDDMENQFRTGTETLDSVVRKFRRPAFDWRYVKLEGENHMSTFPVTFHKGYLALSEKWNISGKDLQVLQKAKGDSLEPAVRSCFEAKSAFRNSAYSYSPEHLRELQLSLAEKKEYETAIGITDLGIKLYETDPALKNTGKEELEKWEQRKQYMQFLDLASKAQKESDVKNYEQASALYLQAFETGAVKGTHMQRIESITAFAQTGNTEEAFKQLEMIATLFKLQGNGRFTENPLLSSLHKDERWEKYMKALEENAQ